MLIVIVNAKTANQAEAERLIAASRALVTATRAEPGCLDYAFGIDSVDPASVRVAERWRSQAEMAEHLKTPHFTTFMGVMQTVAITAMTAKIYDASGERDLF